MSSGLLNRLARGEIDGQSSACGGAYGRAPPGPDLACATSKLAQARGVPRQARGTVRSGRWPGHRYASLRETPPSSSPRGRGSCARIDVVGPRGARLPGRARPRGPRVDRPVGGGERALAVPRDRLDHAGERGLVVDGGGDGGVPVALRGWRSATAVTAAGAERVERPGGSSAVVVVLERTSDAGRAGLHQPRERRGATASAGRRRETSRSDPRAEATPRPIPSRRRSDAGEGRRPNDAEEVAPARAPGCATNRGVCRRWRLVRPGERRLSHPAAEEESRATYQVREALRLIVDRTASTSGPSTADRSL